MSSIIYRVFSDKYFTWCKTYAHNLHGNKDKLNYDCASNKHLMKLQFSIFNLDYVVIIQWARIFSLRIISFQCRYFYTVTIDWRFFFHRKNLLNRLILPERRLSVCHSCEWMSFLLSTKQTQTTKYVIVEYFLINREFVTVIEWNGQWRFRS